jgi:hypothetical protein
MQEACFKHKGQAAHYVRVVEGDDAAIRDIRVATGRDSDSREAAVHYAGAAGV